MSYEKLLEEYLAKGLLKKQKPSASAVEKLIARSEKDLKTAKANLSIDEGIAYTVAYLAMLCYAQGGHICCLKDFVPQMGINIRL